MPQQLKRILMIEDEQDIQAIARLSLETLGQFTVEMCSSGQEALNRVSSFLPDVILLDVMMPNMDGPTTLRALRSLPEAAATPVIFLTAKVQPNEIAQYRAIGALDVISKPFDPMALPDIVRTIWSRHAS